MKNLPKLKTELAFSKVEHLLSIYYEDQLKKEVSRIFQEMRYEVIRNLTEYYNPDAMFQAHMDLILAPIHESHKHYYETLLKYKIREFDKSRAAGKRIVERTINFRRKGNVITNQYTVLKADINDIVSSTISKDKLFGTSDVAHTNLANRTYTLSEKTLSRVDNNINDIITKGYEEGWGINSVAKDINDRFNQLESWEAKRIARTEIHNSHSLGLIQGYDDVGVEYIQWSAANDNRTRDTHISLDGEIIPLGGVFSNGLMYPGDMMGAASEIINCRCQALPFIMPYGYIAPPGMAQFREDDLIATLDYFNADDLITQATRESDKIFDDVRFKQLKTNEEIAEFFGYEYIPKGRYYEQADIKTFEFYDKKTDTILRFAREGDQKCLNIDFTNSGKAEYDLKDVLKIYEETHPNLKVGLDDITFLRGDKYTPGGDAGNYSVRIFDENITHNYSKRGLHAEVEPLEHTLDHELGHLFSDSFLQENEYAIMDDVALNIRKGFKNTGIEDNLLHQQKGLPTQKVSYYAEKNQSECFAEVTAGVSNLKRGNNYKVYAERIKRPDASRPSGFVRDNPTLTEIKSRNPNQFEFVDNLLDHPETVMKNWKSINQKRVKESRARFNEFLKQEQNIVRAKQNMKDYDKYKLSKEGQKLYENLKNKKELILPERQLLKRLDKLNEFNELHNKKLLGEIFDDTLEKRYQKLKKRYGEYVHLNNIDLKQVNVKNRGLFKNENAFELTQNEQELYAKLHVQNKLWKNKLPQQYKSTYQELVDKQELNRLHQKMLDYRLTTEQSDNYIELYYKYKDKWKLPNIKLELSDKFTINQPYFLNYEEFGEIKTISSKFKLTSKQQQELDDLNKLKFLNNGKLTKKQETKLNKLLAQKDFNDLYSLRIQNKGLSYKNNKKYKQAYDTLKKHKYKFPKNSEADLFKDLTPENQIVKVEWKEPANGKYKHLKGAYEDGLTPELRNNFDDYFTIDCRNLTPHQKEHLDNWLYKEHVKINEFLRYGDGDVNKFAKWLNKEDGIPLEKALEIGRERNYTVNVIEDMLDKGYLKKSLTGYRRQRNHHLMDYLPKGEKIIPGETIVPLKGITSVAITEEGATYYVETAGKTLDEMKWLFEIEMPAGTRGTYVSHVTIDKYKPEMEFLTKKDTYVKILEFDEKNYYAKLKVLNYYE